MYLDPAALKKAGFTDTIEDRPPNGIFTVSGFDATGKTFLACQAPGPIGYQGCDMGANRVLPKFRGKKQIIRPAGGDYMIEVPESLQPPKQAGISESADARRKREHLLADYVEDNIVAKWKADFVKLMDLGVRTVVWDTATELWAWVRTTVYGRGASDRSDLQTQANAKWRELVRLAGIRGVNLIMIQQLKPEFESFLDPKGETKWRKTGRFEVQGNDKNPFLVHSSFQMSYRPGNAEDSQGHFYATIMKGGDDPQSLGMVVTDPTWATLMSIVMPNVPLDKWLEGGGE